MDSVNSCRCCLRSRADKSLTTPYTHLGKTEVYCDMLRECFGLQLWVSGSMFSGICSACATRLRDANDFKLQVQHSQLDLLQRLQGSRLVQEEDSAVEQGTESDARSDEDEDFKIEMLDEEELENDMLPSVTKAEDEQRDFLYSIQLEALADVERRTHGLPTPKNLYQCHDCGNTFNVKKGLSRHIQHNCHIGALAAHNKKKLKKHAKKFTYCNYCTYRSKDKNRLYHHEMKHIGEKPYRCDSCNYKTKRKADFERHQSIHDGNKPFECEVCGYKCIQKYTLLVHKRVHSRDKPYACKHCSYKTSRLQCLRKHQRRLHNLNKGQMSEL